MDENYNKNLYESESNSEAEPHDGEITQAGTASEEMVSDHTQDIQKMQDAHTDVPEDKAEEAAADYYGAAATDAQGSPSMAAGYGEQSASNGYDTQSSPNSYGEQSASNSYGTQASSNGYGTQQTGSVNYGTMNQNPYQQYRNPYQQYQSAGTYGQQTGYGYQTQNRQNGEYGQQTQSSQFAGYGQQTQSSQNTSYGQQTPPPSNTSKPAQKKEHKKGGAGAFIGKTVAAALIFGLIGGGVFTGVSYVGTNALGITASDDSNGDSNSNSNFGSGSSSDSESSSSSDTVSTTDTGATAADLTDVSGVVEEVMPSIVAITNISTTTYDSMWGGSQTYETTSLGSGIIIAQDDEYLYICTNNHVVSGSESLTVQFVDDSTVSAEITGTDSSDDLAVIQVALSSIEADTLSQIKVAAVDDSGDVKVGEAVIAIGNALGYGQSVTTGVVSATGRTVSVTDSTTGTTVTNTNLIQTDAAINSGNSGGALLNANGEVIGINAAKYSATGVEGIGYAIPMSDAYTIIKALINGDDIPQSAYLGISGQTISSDVASQYNVPVGVLVAEVIEGTAADEAGIQAGDIITAIDGEEITSMDELKTYLAGLKEGDQVTITLSRQSNNYSYKEMDVEVTLGGQSSTSE